MPDASTSQFLDLLLTLIRWLVLGASTILIVFAAGLILSLLWSRTDKTAVSIRPFVVVDASGKLKSGEGGFAQILAAQNAELQSRVSQARALLKDVIAGSQTEDALRVPESAQKPPGAVDPQQALEKPNLATALAVTESKFDLKIQGIDVSGIFSWIRGQLVPERKGLSFTAHIAEDGTVAIAGDISDMEIKDVNSIYISPAKRSPIEALGELALLLNQLQLAADDSHFRTFSPTDFRDLIDKLCEAADARNEGESDPQRNQHYKTLSTYFAKLVSKHPDWQTMMILAADTARRGGDYQSAQQHFQRALDYEDQLKPKERDAKRLKRIAAGISAVNVRVAAQMRSSAAAKPSPQVLVRRVLRNEDTSDVGALREGFKALYEVKGEGGYIAIAGLHGLPGWYSWNHQQNARSKNRLNLFLPWHRAFLVNLERAAGTKVHNFSLACWDWTKGGIPKAFTENSLPGGGKNPLASAVIDLPQSTPPLVRPTVRSPATGLPLPSSQTVTDVLAKDNWEDFSRALENLSDLVHGWTGGDMGLVATASYDPLFYAHHCNVDRLWAIWQNAHPSMALDPKLLDVVLDPFGMKVSDVLDTKKLGYEYESVTAMN